MKNADMPAMPHTTWDNEIDKVVDQGNGLTKREYFAGLALQGLCTREGYDSPAMVALDAVAAADTLLAELGKSERLGYQVDNSATAEELIDYLTKAHAKGGKPND